MTDIMKLVDAEMKEYSDGAYADHGSAKDQLMRFAELATAPLKAENEALRADAARYQWLRKRYTAVNFDWEESGQQAVIFTADDFPIATASCDETIDRAMEASK